MKGDLDRKDEAGGDHLVPLAPQAVLVLKALWPLSGGTDLLFPSNRHMHWPMSENAIGYLLNRAGYHGHHVPHGFRAAFSTIMNEWAERHGKEHDRKIIDLMLAHVPKEKVESAYNRAAYMARRRELADIWAGMLSEGLPQPNCLIPGFDGASLAQAWKDALWDRFYTAAPERQRQSVERYSIVKRA